MRHAAQYTMFLAMVTMLASGATSTDAAPYRKGRSNTQRASKPSYKSTNRTSSSRSSGPSLVQRKTYPAGNKYKYNTGSSNSKPRGYVTKPLQNQKGGNYHHNPNRGGKKAVYPNWGRKGGKQTDIRGGKDRIYPGPKITGPFVPNPGGNGGKDRIYPGPKITGPFVPNPGGNGGKDRIYPGPKITGPFVPNPGGNGGKDRIYPGPKITGPFVPNPGGNGGKDRIYPGPKITGPIVSGPDRRKTPDIRIDIGRLNPKDVRTLPKINNLNKGLKDFWKKGNSAKNQAELKAVRNFANRCIRNPAACGWWVDFCCHHWWDWCCYPNYWHCWDHCYWDTVYCPSRVVVVNGTQQVLQEVSYYLGMSGSQIPNFGFGIQQVKSGSPAERAGLKQGDVIVSVNGQQMTGEEVLTRSMQQAGGVLDLEVVAQGSETPRMVRVVAEQVRSSSF